MAACWCDRSLDPFGWMLDGQRSTSQSAGTRDISGSAGDPRSWAVTEGRIHRAVSADGTELAGRVHGTGPPLVLVSGVGDGEKAPFLVPRLSERFTCYSMSLRGRGLSDPAPDHAPERLVEDITAFVDSLGPPVGLAGHSRGARVAARARHDAGAADARHPNTPVLQGRDASSGQAPAQLTDPRTGGRGPLQPHVRPRTHR